MSFCSRCELDAIGFRAVGEGVLVSRRASFYGAERITLGNHVRIDDFTVLSAGEGGIVLGDYIHVAVYSSMIGQGRITLDDFVNVSSRVAIYSSNDDYSGEAMTNPMIPAQYRNVRSAPILVGRHAIIGSGSVVLPGVDIGEGVAVGALSLVNRDCLPFGVYVGVPAQRVKERKRDLLHLETAFRAHVRGGLPDGGVK
jgi:dTDP-4-amino-4,6-dideoxy-D-glucose acyltransferase